MRDDATPAVVQLVTADRAVATWWASPVECASAIARRERERAISPRAARQALERLADLQASWHEVAPGQALRRTAIRLLRVHPLRTADALQLAAALTASEDLPDSLEAVTLDRRFAEAARREGFTVLMPSA